MPRNKLRLTAIMLIFSLGLAALVAALNGNRSSGRATPTTTPIPFPTFTSTPSATNTPSPTPTPTPTPDRQDTQAYVAKLDGLFLGRGGIVEWTATFGRLRFAAEQNPALILNQAWRDRVQTAIDGFKARYREVAALTPPDTRKKRHFTIVAALTDCDTGMVKYLEATETLDPQLLTEAIIHLADCKQKFEQLETDRSWRNR